MYTSVSPQKHFCNIMNLVGIASHISCTLLSDYSINFHVYMLISVYILIFLSGNAWCILWMQRYGMTDKPPHIELKVTVAFSSGGHHPQDLTSYETNIYVRCLSTSTFLSIFYHIWVHNIIFIIHLSLFHTHVLSVTYIVIQHSTQL